MNTLQDALLDNRPQKERDRDYLVEEIIGMSSEVKYLTRSEAYKQAKKYTTQDQFGTLSCGGHAGALALQVVKELNDALSGAFIYRHRRNFPNGGMFIDDIGHIAKHIGACLRKNLETPRTEAQANAIKITGMMELEAMKYKGINYFATHTKNIDDYIRISNEQKLPVILFLWGDEKEYSKKQPLVLKPDLIPANAYVRHFVVILPETGYMYRKNKFFLIQDSALFGGEYIREISEDWVRQRTIMGLVFTKIVKEELPKDEVKKLITKPFNVNLRFGERNKEVARMQDFLKTQGLFPLNTPSTGYFGGITLKAVMDFQERHRNFILKFFGMDKPNGFWGARTREQANSLL